MNQLPETVFNLWTLLFSGFASLGIFYGIKLVASSRKNVMEIILGIYLLLHSITLLEYIFYWTHYIFHIHFFCDLSLLFPLLYGPLLLIYFDRSFGYSKPITSYALHFVPFVFFLVLKMPFYFSSPEKKFFHTLEIPLSTYFTHFEWIKIAILVFYGILILLRIQKQTGVGSMRLWAKSILGFFFLYVLLTISYRLLIDFDVYTIERDYTIMLASCLSIGFIAWYGVGFPEIADGKNIATSLMHAINPTSIVEAQHSTPGILFREENEKYKNSGLPISLATKLEEQLELLMKSEKLFIENDLSLEKLANKLGTNKHFVSQVINQRFQMNFFDYINFKRIEEAKYLLQTNSKSKMNIIEVAYMVGFNNKGTFNAVFKKFTGTTPSEFRSHLN